MKIQYTNRRCDYCGVFEGYLHSPNCVHMQSLETNAKEALAPPLHIATPLPPECEPYRVEIARFVEAMIFKLSKNAHKGKWTEYDTEQAFHLLKQEVDELEGAMARGNMVEVLLEAADVGNFALIISAKVIK